MLLTPLLSIMKSGSWTTKLPDVRFWHGAAGHTLDSDPHDPDDALL